MANAKLLELANIDGLTGVANRRRMGDFLDAQWRTATREGYSMSLLMLDIDFFKLYNDTYGHQAGDETLRKVAEALTQYARRPTDLAARYGGEEFVLLLGKTEPTAALAIAEAITSTVRGLGIEHKASPCASVVTVSIGIASRSPAKDPSTTGIRQLLKSADDALYLAKQTGRNRVVVYSETSAES